MINTAHTITAAVLALGIAGSANAAIDIHVTGSDWGVWVTGLFSSFDNPDGSVHHAYSDFGSGAPMDFMMPLSDGTFLDGSDVNMRMITADTVGNVGDAELGLASWSLWIGVNDISLHVIWSSNSTGPLALDNLGSSGKDGVSYGVSGIGDTLDWTLERADGSFESFSTSFDSFEITLPAPGATALLGLGGLVATRRRR